LHDFRFQISDLRFPGGGGATLRTGEKVLDALPDTSPEVVQRRGTGADFRFRRPAERAADFRPVSRFRFPCRFQIWIRPRADFETARQISDFRFQVSDFNFQVDSNLNLLTDLDLQISEPTDRQIQIEPSRFQISDLPARAQLWQDQFF
jgi:hypothetical protein